jgi:hypothetical protein
MVERFEGARALAANYHDVAVGGLMDFQLGWCDVLMLRYPESLRRFDAALRVPNTGYRHLIEVNRAWALLALDRVNEAEAAVEEFSDVPAGSQWGHLNLAIAHAVMAHRLAPEEVARSFAAEAKELVARQPQVSSTLVQGFAYLAHVRGDEQRSNEITSQTLPLHGEQLWNWLVLRPLGANGENFVQVRAAYERDHPLLERFSVDAQHGRALLDEEIARWS